ncbi:MAG TPA: hypothetical protein PKK56_02435 [archaeon]|jgi:hypothetical protein|nr:hypothetical protein [archaeon]HRT03950.1 hypothetical protein [Candidatus Diapherotrites archaeon]
MSFLNPFKKKEKTETKKIKDNQINLATAKYPNETCALCSQKGCDVKWGGQYWHKKCLRTTKNMAKGMI